MHRGAPCVCIYGLRSPLLLSIHAPESIRRHSAAPSTLP